MMNITNIQLNTKKIKYDKLVPLFKHELKSFNREDNDINIFIDVESFIKGLYSSQFSATMNSEYSSGLDQDKINFTTELINIITHYRHGFASRLNCATKFFFFFSQEKDENMIESYPDYRKKYYEKRCDMFDPSFGIMNQNINANIGIFKQMVRVIPGCYYFDTQGYEHTMIPHYIMEYTNIPKQGDFNLILSNNDIFYQMVSEFDDMYICEIKGDDSQLITKDNLLSKWVSTKNSNLEDVSKFLDAGKDGRLINLSMALSANKILETKSIKRTGKKSSYTKFLKNDIECIIYNTPETALHGLESMNLSEEEKDKFIQNFICCNFSSYVSKYQNTYKVIFDNAFVDLPDAMGLKIVNETILERNAIDLDYLFEGSRFEKYGYQ